MDVQAWFTVWNIYGWYYITHDWIKCKARSPEFFTRVGLAIGGSVEGYHCHTLVPYKLSNGCYAELLMG